MESDANLVEAGNFRKYENGLLRRGEEDYVRRRGASGVTLVRPQRPPPTPKEPIAYWRYQQAESEVGNGRGELSILLMQMEALQ